MKVKATKLGYYNLKRRYPGDVFELRPVKGLDKDRKEKVFTAAEQFSEFWMKPVDQTTQVSKSPLKPNLANGRKSAASVDSTSDEAADESTVIEEEVI